jgi:glucokinase
MRYILGVDIGGTNLVVGAVTEDGARVRGLLSEPTGAPDGPDAVIDRILRMARSVTATTHQEDPDAEIAGVGIGSPGPLDRKRGVVIFTPNLR